MEKRDSHWENTSVRLAYKQVSWTFSWFKSDMGGSLIWCLGSNKKVGWISPKEQASKKQFLHGFCYNFCLQVPNFSFCPDFPQWWVWPKVKKKNVYLSMVMVFCNRNINSKKLCLIFYWKIRFYYDPSFFEWGRLFYFFHTQIFRRWTYELCHSILKLLEMK